MQQRYCQNYFLSTSVLFFSNVCTQVHLAQLQDQAFPDERPGDLMVDQGSLVAVTLQCSLKLLFRGLFFDVSGTNG